MKAITSVMNIYIIIHTMTNLSVDNYQLWAYGERKRKHIDTKTYISANKHVVFIIYASTVL